MPAEKPRLLAQVKGRKRARHLSPRTERAYVGWTIRNIRYHGTRHPTELGETGIIAFLTYLAAERRVSRSTQMQALSTLRLLYRDVLAIPGWAVNSRYCDESYRVGSVRGSILCR